MIAYLEGVLREKTPTRVVIDVAGVGYEVQIPLSTFAALPDEGKTVALRIHTHVRDDAIQLFGFRTARERAVFELLIRTSGVGPRSAQAILSGIDPDELLEAVRRGDLLALRAVPGVGPKTAQRIVFELRDRAEALLAEAPGAPRRSRAPAEAEGADLEAVVSALLNLGMTRERAERAARAAADELGEQAPIEERVRVALRRLAR